jgi:multidrug efflux pump subunit AcrA (membrane-fusion protein)
MSFWKRLRFFFGIVFVILLVGALVLYLNSIMSVVHAYRAKLAADAINVGTDYPGLVVKQNINPGDKVNKGDVLFDIKSPQLSDSISKGEVSSRSLPFKIDSSTGDILVTASDDGVIEKVNSQTGSYVPQGAVLATIDTVGSLYVVANYHLTPPDYARVERGGMVDLTFPDNSQQQAKIFAISITNDGDQVSTVVKARLQHANLSDYQFSVGTPVQATLHLSNKTWFQSLYELLQQLLKPGGTK